MPSPGPNGMPPMPDPYAPGVAPPEPASPAARGPADFLVYHDNPVPLWTQWDVGSTMSALDAHTLGQFYSSGQLSDAMTMDDAFDSVVQTRILGLISRPFKLVPSKKCSDPKLAKRACAVVSERWDTMFPDDVLSSLMQQWLLMGFSIGQVSWGYEERLWMPTQVQPWHATNSWFDIATRYYVANTMEGSVYLRPGRGDWLLLAPFGQYRGWLRGAVRAVAIPWLARQYALRDWARYSEVHGLPIKKVKVPAEAKGADKQAMLEAFANLANESTAILPQGFNGDPRNSYDLELLEAKADTWKAFEGLVNKCETRMAIRLLGQNLTTEIDAGSLAAANVHDRVRLDYTRFDAKAMNAIRKQVLGPLCEFNFGDAEAAPDLVWDTKPPDDKAAQGRVISELGQAALNFANAGTPVDIRALLKLVGIPTLPDGVLPPPPPDPGQKPEGGGFGPGGGKTTSRRSPRCPSSTHSRSTRDSSRRSSPRS